MIRAIVPSSTGRCGSTAGTSSGSSPASASGGRAAGRLVRRHRDGAAGTPRPPHARGRAHRPGCRRAPGRPPAGPDRPGDGGPRGGLGGAHERQRQPLGLHLQERLRTEGGQDQLLGVDPQGRLPLAGPHDRGQVRAVLTDVVGQLRPGARTVRTRTSGGRHARVVHEGHQHLVVEPLGVHAAVVAGVDRVLEAAGDRVAQVQPPAVVAAQRQPARGPLAEGGPRGVRQPGAPAQVRPVGQPHRPGARLRDQRGVRSRSTSRTSSPIQSTSNTRPSVHGAGR